MVNITNTGAAPSTPPSATIPDTLVGAQFSTSIYGYASPNGTVNNVSAGIPRFVGTAFLNVTLASGAATWTGLNAGVSGQHVILWNKDANNTLTLAIANAGSRLENQFQGSAGNYAIIPGNTIHLVYQGGSTAAWLVVP